MEEKETLPLPKATGMLRELQLANLAMMKKFDKVAREHGIKYTLGAGSAIGAIVHKGFIPWDDDIDILMDRENFDKLKNWDVLDICDEISGDNKTVERIKIGKQIFKEGLENEVLIQIINSEGSIDKATIHKAKKLLE